MGHEQAYKSSCCIAGASFHVMPSPRQQPAQATGWSKRGLAKLSGTCSFRADGLCIVGASIVGGRKAGNSNMQEFLRTTPCNKAKWEITIAQCNTAIYKLGHQLHSMGEERKTINSEYAASSSSSSSFRSGWLPNRCQCQGEPYSPQHTS